MKKHTTLLLTAAALLAVPAAAQISIDRVEPQSENVSFADSIRRQRQVGHDAFSLAKYRAERAAIRRERNYLEISGAVQGTLSSFNDPVDRGVGRRQLNRADRNVLPRPHLHQGKILDRDQGQRQIRLQPHQGRARRRGGRGRHLVQESGRVLGPDRTVVQLLAELVLRRRAQVPHPVRQRLQGPHAAEGDSSQEHSSCRRAISTCRSV